MSVKQDNPKVSQAEHDFSENIVSESLLYSVLECVYLEQVCMIRSLVIGSRLAGVVYGKCSSERPS